MFSKIEIGDKVIAPCSDGIRFGWADGGGLLVIHYSSPTPEEKLAFKNELSIRFATANGIIFILSRIGRTSNWDDCPYYRYYRAETPVETPIIRDGEGLLFHVMLVDASNGVLVAQKILGCQTEGSRKFIEAMKGQTVITNYDRVLAKTMAQYSTPRLVQQSILLF